MSAENLSGSIYGVRQGGVPVYQSKKITIASMAAYTTATSTNIVVRASADQPVIVEAQIIVVTADGGTSPTASVGFTATGYTDLVNAASTATAATNGTFLPASNANGKVLLTADTEIFFKNGGVPSGTGVYWIILEIVNLNPR